MFLLILLVYFFKVFERERRGEDRIGFDIVSV